MLGNPLLTAAIQGVIALGKSKVEEKKGVPVSKKADASKDTPCDRDQPQVKPAGADWIDPALQRVIKNEITAWVESGQEVFEKLPVLKHSVFELVVNQMVLSSVGRLLKGDERSIVDGALKSMSLAQPTPQLAEPVATMHKAIRAEIPEQQIVQLKNGIDGVIDRCHGSAPKPHYVEKQVTVGAQPMEAEHCKMAQRHLACLTQLQANPDKAAELKREMIKELKAFYATGAKDYARYLRAAANSEQRKVLAQMGDVFEKLDEASKGMASAIEDILAKQVAFIKKLGHDEVKVAHVYKPKRQQRIQALAKRGQEVCPASLKAIDEECLFESVREVAGEGAVAHARKFWANEAVGEKLLAEYAAFDVSFAKVEKAFEQVINAYVFVLGLMIKYDQERRERERESDERRSEILREEIQRQEVSRMIRNQDITRTAVRAQEIARSNRQEPVRQNHVLQVTDFEPRIRDLENRDLYETRVGESELLTRLGFRGKPL